MKQTKLKPSSSSPQMLYGINPVMEALRAGLLSTIYLSPSRRAQIEEIIEEAKDRKVSIKTMHDPSFFDRRFPKAHQGIAADLKEGSSLSTSLEDLLDIPARKKEPAFFIILDEVEDPRNLGAILRSAEAAGMHGAVLQSHRSASLGPEAMKSSSGALAYLPVATVPNIKNAMIKMRDEGIVVVGAEAGAPKSAWKTDLTGPIALVTGSEGKGLRRTVAEKCDLIVSLPIRGHINSLNTSVAAGILIYEVLRQRGH